MLWDDIERYVPVIRIARSDLANDAHPVRDRLAIADLVERLAIVVDQHESWKGNITAAAVHDVQVNQQEAVGWQAWIGAFGEADQPLRIERTVA